MVMAHVDKNMNFGLSIILLLPELGILPSIKLLLLVQGWYL
jgi:hypothetical protein